jgi:hypothetical protein
MGEETRRNFILAGSAQALFALQTDLAFGQAVQTPPDLTKLQIEALDRVIDGIQFRRADDLSGVFRRLLETKLDVTIATIADDAKTILLDLAMKAQNTLQKDFGTNGPIPRENLRGRVGGYHFVPEHCFWSIHQS